MQLWHKKVSQKQLIDKRKCVFLVRNKDEKQKNAIKKSGKNPIFYC